MKFQMICIGLTAFAFGVTSNANAVPEVLKTKCLACHSGAAPAGGLSFARGAQALIETGHVVPKNPAASLIFDRIKEGIMPPAPMQKLSSAEIAEVGKWIRSLSGPGSIVAQTQAAGALSAKELLPIATQFLTGSPDHLGRIYVSFAGLIQKGMKREQIEIAHQAVLKAINSVSRNPKMVFLQKIDVSGQLWYFDSSKLGWTDRSLSFIERDAHSESVQSLRSDLEKIAGPQVTDSSWLDRLYEADRLVVALTNAVPYLEILRPNFLVDRPSLSQFVEEAFGLFPPGLRDNGVQVAGYRVSGVSLNQRTIFRSSFRSGYYWGSADFAANSGDRDLELNPRAEGDGGEFIVSLPNGLQAYFLANSEGDLLLKAPREIVVNSHIKEGVVRTPGSCFTCHGNIGIIPRSESEAAEGPGYQAKSVTAWLKKDSVRYQSALKTLGIQRADNVEVITAVRKWLNR